MKKSFIFYLLMLNIGISNAQHLAQSKTQPLHLFLANVYVTIPAQELKATLVKTKRNALNTTQYVDLINIILPNDFVRNKLVDTKDIGDTGLFTHDQLLICFAVLPDLRTGNVTWVPFSPDSVPASRQVAWRDIADDCYTRLFNYEALGGPAIDWSRRRLDLRPVIKKGNQYFTTNQTVLTEYFLLRNMPTWYPTSGDNATINCLAHPFTPADYAAESMRITDSILKGQEVPRLRGELTTKLLLQKVENNIYTFWSLPPKIFDANIASFGAGELKFQPEIGLISGKYSQYFGLDSNDMHNIFFDLISIQKI
ncbi:hypothetical protein [Hymenobacter baengnokdamensis]|uniref:hypothetical protein n=1 Tax=Hymenobacter baengnokdamensis TaxID=2615203 RepID=UPI00124806ED|nr:hypothetical protein [Hymenobacter baengnokdamensis]